MPIIYSYPTATPVGTDTIIGTQQALDETGDNLTVTFTIASIANYVASSILPSGTPNYLPVFSTASTFTDSPIFVNSFSAPTLTTIGTNVTIAGSGVINDDLTVGGETLTNTLEVGTTAEIQGELSMGGVINMSGQLINNVADPIDPQDAATKAYVDANTEEVEFAVTLRQPARFLTPVQPGDPVYIVGFNVGQNRYEVDLAQAGDPARMPAIGISADTYGINDNGFIITHGEATKINTNAFDVGDTVWVGQFGGLTNTRPSGTNLVQNVGIVGKKSGGAGEIEAIALGRTNDVPNIPRGSMWVGNATGVATPLPIGAAGQILVSDGTDVNWQNDDTDVSLTQGSLWIGDAANKKSELAVGSPNQILVSNGTTAVWQDDDTDVSLTHNKIWIGNSSGKKQESSNVYFDDTANIYTFGPNHIIGLNPTFSFGYGNESTGTRSFSSGFQNNATGYSSFTFGDQNSATSNHSIAIGSTSAATNDFSVAVGNMANSSGNSAIALGEFSTASGTASVAFGWLSQASGNYAAAIGREAFAGGNYSGAFGALANNNNFNYSTALGYLAINTIENQTAIGQKVLLNAYGSGTITGTAAYNLGVDASGNVIEVPGNTALVDGSGTTNYIPIWTGATTLGNSRIFDDGIRLSAGTSNNVSSSTTTYTIGDSNDLDGSRSIVIGFSNVTKNIGTPGYSNNTFVIGDRNNTNDSSSGISSNNYVYGFNNIVGGSTNYVIGNTNTATSIGNYLFGKQNRDNGGFASILVGTSNTGGSNRGVAIGFNSVSSIGSDNIAIGSNNLAVELRSLAIGHSNIAGDSFKLTRNAYAIGTGNSNHGTNSTAIGVSNNVLGGTNLHVWGQGNNIEDNNITQAHILGSNNQVGFNLDATGRGNGTFTIGLDNYINGNNVYSFGNHLNSAGSGIGVSNSKIMLLGWYNDYTTNAGPGPQASIMQFGIGDSDINRKNILEFTKDGRIIMDTLQASSSYTDDPDAAANGVRVGQLYRTGSTIKIRVS